MKLFWKNCLRVRLLNIARRNKTFYLFLLLFIFNKISGNSQIVPMSELSPIDSILSLEWKVRISENNWFDSPLIHNGFIFINGEETRAYHVSSGKSYAFSNKNTQDIFRKTFSDSIIGFRRNGELILVDIFNNKVFNYKHDCWYNDRIPYFLKSKNVFTIENYRSVKAFDFIKNKTYWTKEIPNCRGYFIEYDNSVYFFNDKNLYCLEIQTGKLVWESSIPEVIQKPILISEDKFWLFSEQGIHEVDMKAKTIDKIYNGIMSDVQSPILEDGIFYNPDCAVSINAVTKKELYNNRNSIYNEYEIQCFLKGGAVTKSYLFANVGDSEGCTSYRTTLVYDKLNGIPKYCDFKDVELLNELGEYGLIFSQKIYNDKLIAIGYDKLFCFKVKE